MNDPVPMTLRRSDGVLVQIPTLAPFPRMTVFEVESETFAPIAVALVIVPSV